MRTLARTERGFTLIELLIVVAILGILAAVVIPNVGRFLGSGETEANATELQNIQTAVVSMMVDNGITTLAPAADNNDMTAWPDTTTIVSGTLGVGSVAGLRLFGHDIDQSDTTNGPLVNYLASNTTKCIYSALADGTVTQISC